MSTPAEIRAHAARVVAQVVQEGRSLDGLLDERSASAQARGLLRTLCYGTIRWHVRLQALLRKLLTQPQQALDPDINALVNIGLFQLLHTDIAAHAAVAETVEATKVLNKPRAAGLVNALLRRCQREGAVLLASMDADIALRTAHPRWFVEQLEDDWGEQAISILDANNAHPPFWLRVNRRVMPRDSYRERLAAAGLHCETSEIAPDALLLPNAIDVHALPGFAEGWVSVQDAAPQLAAHLLQAEVGDRVLDACAAPGGKTCHIAELTPNLRELVALDVSPQRLRRVRDNLQRLSLTATLVAGDASQPDTWWDGLPFNRILLDVPCSATGVIRRHPDIKLLRRDTDIAALAGRQFDILKASWPLLAPGGRVVYASCSVLSAENANVIARFLNENDDASDVTSSAFALLGMQAHDEIGRRIVVGEAAMDGFYYACLQKSRS